MAPYSRQGQLQLALQNSKRHSRISRHKPVVKAIIMCNFIVSITPQTPRINQLPHKSPDQLLKFSLLMVVVTQIKSRVKRLTIKQGSKVALLPYSGRIRLLFMDSNSMRKESSKLVSPLKSQLPIVSKPLWHSLPATMRRRCIFN